MEKERIIFINDIEEAKGKTIIRAHGVPKEVYEKARKINIPLIDLNCPSVLKIQKIVEEYSKKEFFIIIVGNNNHPEIIGIKSRAGNKYIVIANKEELNGNFEKFQYEKNILLISQTTHSSKKFDEIAKELKSRLNDNTNLEIKKQFALQLKLDKKKQRKLQRKLR